MRFSQVVESLEGVIGSSLVVQPGLDPELERVAAVDGAIAHDLSYIEGDKFAEYITTTQASALILPQQGIWQQQTLELGIAWVSVANPRMAFAQAIALFYQPFRPEPGIHSTAVIHPTARLGEQVSIGAHVVIQADVVIGNEVCIHANVVVYPGSVVGDRTILHANCVIHERSQIGQDCIIHSGAAIGSEGFGFEPTPEGWLKMEQSGIAVLEDRVRVGCNTAIDRPAVGETRIQHDTIIDNLVQIGHGATVGYGCALAGQVGLAGGVTVGDRAILAGQVGVANRAKVGPGATVTAQGGVMSNVPAKATVSGSPTMPFKDWLKSSALNRRLPELQQQLRELQKQVAALESQIKQL
ncbi:MAG: UDP-3-O-(3-hydroxymyristoyl)glucosamine N-acyltransferase [Cyanothece sp. SIO2G6]|nr:UDP-3-O-(3-hydroxymyristoyl)glucosamine N-acyltransferase [Cyanothece sp. SIO2G6]